MANDTYDPDGKEQHEAGSKLDAGKVAVVKGVFGYFPKALRAIARLSMTGGIKYTWGGWSAVDNATERYLEADGRHLLDYLDPDEPDLDLTYDDGNTKFYHHHLVAHAWNALAALEKAIEDGLETDKKI